VRSQPKPPTSDHPHVGISRGVRAEAAAATPMLVDSQRDSTSPGAALFSPRSQSQPSQRSDGSGSACVFGGGAGSAQEAAGAARHGRWKEQRQTRHDSLSPCCGQETPSHARDKETPSHTPSQEAYTARDGDSGDSPSQATTETAATCVGGPPWSAPTPPPPRSTQVSTLTLQ
jgi:hypothetical protein